MTFSPPRSVAACRSVCCRPTTFIFLRSMAFVLGSVAISACGPVSAGASGFASHPPMRPLPQASSRQMAAGPARFVALDGDDQADGSQDHPWRSINHALRQAVPGDTIYLRAGTYYERLIALKSGTAEKPITLRSYPGELVVIDGGLGEFHDDPAGSWEPLAGGAEHEYVSKRTYPAFAERPVLNSFMTNGWEPLQGKEDERPVVLGHFGDSLVPLHGYRTLADLRDTSMLWDIDGKNDTDGSMYCGPGLWFNPQTLKIHVRLAHTNLEGLDDLAYRGETDPRKIPLCVSAPIGVDVVRINGIKHFTLQDLVLRGASGNALVNLAGSENVNFEGLTIYGGAPAIMVRATTNVKITDCAFRSLAAPWSSRASMKYRGTPSYVIMGEMNQPENSNFEIAYSEFTDGHDGVFVRFIKNLKFHHNYVDNFNDDGLEVGARKRDQEIYAWQNLFSRCLITFTLHEILPDESPADVDPGAGVYLTRNIVDLRRGTLKTPPKTRDPSGAYLNQMGMLCSDHGGPIWPDYYFYHNTVLRADDAFRDYYGFGMGAQGMRNNRRRTFNNCFVQLSGVPGLNFGGDVSKVDAEIDGNLMWSVADGAGQGSDFFAKNQGPLAKKFPPPERWMKHDQFADPKFARLSTDPKAPFDATLQESSPAIDAGVPVPAEWFDPLRAEDKNAPDQGALPQGTKPWTVGVRGRLTAFGTER